MGDSESAAFGSLWADLNPLGRAGTVAFALLLLTYVIPWEPIEHLHGWEPVTVHFVSCVVLLMIDVPLAWTVWKRGNKMALLILLAAIVSFVFARLKLEGDHRWRPNTPFMMMWTLVLVNLGVGSKRRPARPGQ